MGHSHDWWRSFCWCCIWRVNFLFPCFVCFHITHYGWNLKHNNTADSQRCEASSTMYFMFQKTSPSAQDLPPIHSASKTRHCPGTQRFSEPQSRTKICRSCTATTQWGGASQGHTALHQIAFWVKAMPYLFFFIKFGWCFSNSGYKSSRFLWLIH